jgi:hypothetical protein
MAVSARGTQAVDEECRSFRGGPFGLLVDGVKKTFLVDWGEGHFVALVY